MQNLIFVNHLAKIYSEMNLYRNTITIIQEETKTLHDDIDSLNTYVDQNFNSINDQLSILTSDVGTLSNNVDVLTTNVNTLNTSYNNITNDIQAINTRIDDIEINAGFIEANVNTYDNIPLVIYQLDTSPNSVYSLQYKLIGINNDIDSILYTGTFKVTQSQIDTNPSVSETASFNSVDIILSEVNVDTSTEPNLFKINVAGVLNALIKWKIQIELSKISL